MLKVAEKGEQTTGVRAGETAASSACESRKAPPFRGLGEFLEDLLQELLQLGHTARNYHHGWIQLEQLERPLEHGSKLFFIFLERGREGGR